MAQHAAQIAEWKAEELLWKEREASLLAERDRYRARWEAASRALKRIASYSSRFGPSDEARLAEACLAEVGNV